MRVADCGQLWSLRNSEGWVIASDDAGLQLIPIWPHARYAQACAIDEWADCAPQSIEVHDFLDRWIPGSEKDGRHFAVFPVPDSRGVPVDAARLSADLKEELAKLE